jgi:hypothetical protein
MYRKINRNSSSFDSPKDILVNPVQIYMEFDDSDVGLIIFLQIQVRPICKERRDYNHNSLINYTRFIRGKIRGAQFLILILPD